MAAAPELLVYACPSVHTQRLCFVQEGDEYEVIPGSEFTVARTANRSAEQQGVSATRPCWQQQA
jgi:hypothetical protein